MMKEIQEVKCCMLEYCEVSFLDLATNVNVYSNTVWQKKVQLKGGTFITKQLFPLPLSRSTSVDQEIV